MSQRIQRLVYVATCASVALVWMAQARPTSADAAPPAGRAQDPPGYIGADTCLVCHADTTVAGAHTRAWNPRTPAAAHGCETCHGPGEAHLESGGEGRIVDFRALTSREVTEACTTCHTRGNHVFWEGSAHEARNLSCVTCHSEHAPTSPAGQLVAASESLVCADCHRNEVAKLDRSGHMPVREGKMTCSSCHDPHGATNVRLLRAGDSVTGSCTSCHTDKRGPFLFEHAPVRENCATCHDPHGAATEGMLVTRQPMLCQQCHIHTGHPNVIYDNTVVNSSSRLFSRSCVNCHSNIHGSNHPAGVTFLR